MAPAISFILAHFILGILLGQLKSLDASPEDRVPAAAGGHPLKALSAPARFQSTMDAWSHEIRLDFVPQYPVDVHFQGVALGYISDSHSSESFLSFEPEVLSFDGREPSKTFRLRGSRVGYYTVKYELRSATGVHPPTPWEGPVHSLVHIVDKASLTIVPPAHALVAGQRSQLAHKMSLSRALNVRVAPVAEGLTFDPPSLSFSAAGPPVKEFRVSVSAALPESFRRSGDDGATFAVPVVFEVSCPEGESEDAEAEAEACDLDHMYPPAEVSLHVTDVNELTVEESIIAGARDTFELPIGPFKYPQDELLVEVHSAGLALSRNVLRLSREDTKEVNREVRVVGRRDPRRSCPVHSPCAYQVTYLVKDPSGRLSENIKQQRSTTVYLFDTLLEIELPQNGSGGFVGQEISLSLDWPDLDESVPGLPAHSGGDPESSDDLFQVHISASENATVDPPFLRYGGDKSFRVTTSAEGDHYLTFSIHGPLKSMVTFKGAGAGAAGGGGSRQPSVVSVTSFESFYSDSFSFAERYGIGGLDTQLRTILRRAFLSRVASSATVDALGVRHVKGILLFGPPGCGKTMVARQIGLMLNTHPPKVVNGPEVISKFLGASEAAVRALFADAEADRSGDRLHLIVFDEIDALVKPRGRGQGEAADQVYDGVVNTLLSKMDGIDQLDNILIVGTTAVVAGWVLTRAVTAYSPGGVAGWLRAGACVLASLVVGSATLWAGKGSLWALVPSLVVGVSAVSGRLSR